MPIYGLQNGVFQQGNFPNGAGTDPSTGLPNFGTDKGDAAFLGSKFHQRGRGGIASQWWFPTAKFNPNGQGYTCRIIIDYPPQTQYRNGNYVAIDFLNGFTKLADGTYIDSANPSAGFFASGQENYAANPGGTIYNFQSGNWTYLTYPQYYGQPTPLQSNGQPFPWMIAVAPWGQNGFSLRTAQPVRGGTFRGGNLGTLAGIWGYISRTTWLIPQTGGAGFGGLFQADAIGGQVNFQIVSADFTKTIDITPGGMFKTDGVNDYVPMATFNTVALLGSATAWYPQIVHSAVPDPGFAGSYRPPGGVTSLQSQYGAMWTNVVGTF